jgi:hypothetical protein
MSWFYGGKISNPGRPLLGCMVEPSDANTTWLAARLMVNACMSGVGCISPKACHNAGCSVFTYSIRPGEPVIVRGLFIVERVWGGIPKISMMLDVQEVIMVTSKS